MFFISFKLVMFCVLLDVKWKNKIYELWNEMFNFELIEFLGVDYCEIRCRDFCMDNDVDFFGWVLF